MRRRVSNNIQKGSKNKKYNNSTFASTRMTSLPTPSSHHHENSFGITLRRPGNNNNVPLSNNDTPTGGIPAAIKTDIGSITTTTSDPSSSPLSPKTPVIPTLSDFLIHDDEYGIGKKHFGSQTPKNSYAGMYYNQQYAYNIQCAKFCSFFSFIAILFLLMVGILIEVQPLYLKGVSPARVPMSLRRMRESGQVSSEKEMLSYVHYSGRLRMLQSYYLHQHQQKGQSSASIKRKDSSSASSFFDSTSLLNQRLGTYDDDPTTNYVKYNQYLRELSNQQKEHIVYEMKSEAKTAFRAAALYFLVMVFCIIYTHNLERVHLILGVSCNMFLTRVKHFVVNGGWRRVIMVLLNRYRRRDYRDIPEQRVGSKKRRPSNSVESPTKKGDGELSHNTSLESMIGLSMRERDSTPGRHFEQQEMQPTIQATATESFDDIEEKPKKK